MASTSDFTASRGQHRVKAVLARQGARNADQARQAYEAGNDAMEAAVVPDRAGGIARVADARGWWGSGSVLFRLSVR